MSEEDTRKSTAKKRKHIDTITTKNNFDDNLYYEKIRSNRKKTSKQHISQRFKDVSRVLNFSVLQEEEKEEEEDIFSLDCEDAKDSQLKVSCKRVIKKDHPRSDVTKSASKKMEEKDVRAKLQKKERTNDKTKLVEEEGKNTEWKPTWTRRRDVSK
ncbi:MtlA [Acrasis kona]|uniref:MtlA n=1 Tax=Acrasis kona TaxID=1008807 RepID=A0AAW2ZPJ4_9EUKA